jgi:dTDP-4-dehydrorhamnose reductase
MRVLVTGAGGMLGTELVRQLGGDSIGMDLPQLDILDAAAVGLALREHRPHWLVNCAAFTNVDGCEGNTEAYRANADGPGVLAACCEDVGVPMVQISTDYVFHGALRRPYTEEDAPDPLSDYGRGKLEGEQAALAAHPNGLVVVRTAWLFGRWGRCFPSWVLKAAREGKPLRIVADQVGSPTYVPDLARALIRLMTLSPQPGIYHLVNSGRASRHDQAVETLRLAGIDVPVEPISSAERPARARRPAYSVLDCDKAAALGVGPLRPWQEALADFVAGLRDAGQVS